MTSRQSSTVNTFQIYWPLFVTCDSLGEDFADCACSFKAPSCSLFKQLHTFPPGSSSAQTHGFTEGNLITVEGNWAAHSFFLLPDLISHKYFWLLLLLDLSLLVK